MKKIYTSAIKYIILVCSCVAILIACKEETIQKKEIVSLKKNTFKINGTLDNFYPQKV